MELPRIFKFKIGNAGKNRRCVSGFTLIEIMLVMGILVLISAGSVVFGLPAISQFSCNQEYKTVLVALERARSISQFNKKGNTYLKITPDAYEIYTVGRDNLELLADTIDRQSSISVTSNHNVIFGEHSQNSLTENAEILVGSASSSCERTITINHADAIL